MDSLQAGSVPVGTAATIPRLVAPAPDPRRAAELELFGQFVGDWEIDVRVTRPDGTLQSGRGDVHFGWILEGRAVQDVWYATFDAPRSGDRRVMYGTTLRFPDPTRHGWRCLWISPEDNVVQAFVARVVGPEIVLDGRGPAGDPEQWIYSEVRPDRFQWRCMESHDRRATWQETQRIWARRARTPAAARA